MKLTNQIKVQLVINNLSHLAMNESATADRIGKAIADLEKSRSAKTSKNLEHILRGVIDTLREVKEKIPRELRAKLSKEVSQLNTVMVSMGFKVPSSYSKVNPKT